MLAYDRKAWPLVASADLSDQVTDLSFVDLQSELFGELLGSCLKFLPVICVLARYAKRSAHLRGFLQDLAQVLWLSNALSGAECGRCESLRSLREIVFPGCPQMVQQRKDPRAQIYQHTTDSRININTRVLTSVRDVLALIWKFTSDCRSGISDTVRSDQS